MTKINYLVHLSDKDVKYTTTSGSKVSSDWDTTSTKVSNVLTDGVTSTSPNVWVTDSSGSYSIDRVSTISTLPAYGMSENDAKKIAKEILEDFIKWAKEKKSDSDVLDLGLTIKRLA